MTFFEWVGLRATRPPVEVGDLAPDVIVRDEDGRNVRLSDFYGLGPTLLFFYPKALTPGCTAQACSLRDSFADLQDRGVHVIGVSTDKPEVQKRFKEKNRLPFVLLADTERVVAQAFGVRLLLGLTHRQAFLIKEGRVVWRDLKASTREQAQDVLEALDGLG